MSGGRAFRSVLASHLVGGASILADFKYHFWSLDLDCGHTVERRIRWKPVANANRGFAAQHAGVSLTRLPDPPKRARCEQCRAAGEGDT